MTYVTVKEETEERLHLAREPSPRAWAVAFGIVALGLGAACSSVDGVIWKIAYVSGAVFMGLCWMEDWEDCIFNKSTYTVTIRRQSLIQRIFQATHGQRLVEVPLDDLSRVSVQEEEVSRGNPGYFVVMHFTQGFELGITETVTAGDKSEHERVAAKIRNFLNLAETGATTPMSEMGPLDDNGSTTSEDSFEKIDRADIPVGGDDSANEAPSLDSPDVEINEVKEDLTKKEEDEPKA